MPSDFLQLVLAAEVARFAIPSRPIVDLHQTFRPGHQRSRALWIDVPPVAISVQRVGEDDVMPRSIPIGVPRNKAASGIIHFQRANFGAEEMLKLTIQFVAF